MVLECKKSSLLVENQVKINVFYENYNVGIFYADLVVDKKIIIELKAVSKLNKIHSVQLLNYLSATRFRLGLLINFGSERLEVKRIIN